MSEEAKTVELPEEVVEEKPQLPTREEAIAQGLTAQEADSAEKRGLLKVEGKKEEKTGEEKKEEVKPEEKKEAVVEKKPSSLPDFTIEDPEKERVFLETFGPKTPQRGMYFRMKNERKARQNAVAEAQKEREARIALEARLAALEKGKEQPVDDDGNPIDPENQPLTLKQLRELQKMEQERIEKQQAEMGQRAAIVRDAQEAQEEYARSVYPDFDEVVERAKDVMQNLDKVVPEKWKQAKTVKLIRDLQAAAANADKIDLEDWNAALIAYEIGLMHPDHGKKPKETEPREVPKDPKANGSLTPEQMERIKKNAQKGVSSASIPGGSGRRTVSVEEVTLADLSKMDYKERQTFRDNHPEAYAKLVRG